VNGCWQKSGVDGRGRTQLKLTEYFLKKTIEWPKLLQILSIFEQKFTDLHANLCVGIHTHMLTRTDEITLIFYHTFVGYILLYLYTFI